MTSDGQKNDRPFTAIMVISPKTITSEAAIAPAFSQIHGVPDWNQCFIVVPYRVLYLFRRRWRTISAMVFTVKVRANRTSAARNRMR